jgi:hypothetical protein
MNHMPIATLVLLAVLATTSCSAQRPQPSATSQRHESPSDPTTNVNQNESPSSTTVPGSAPGAQTPTGDEVGSEPDPAAVATDPSQLPHDNDSDLVEPLAWPEPPPLDAAPVEIVAWVATVLTNTSADQPFDPTVVAPYLTPELAADYQSSTRLAGTVSPPVVTRGVVLRSEPDTGTATSSQVSVDTVIELTSSTTDGFDIQALRFTLTRRPDHDGWVIAGITTTTADSR